MNLAYDICRCHDNLCPLALSCERYIQRYDVASWTPSTESMCKGQKGWSFDYIIPTATKRNQDD